MTTRMSFGGDEHIFVELDEEMSLDACFRALALTKAVRESGIHGITEVCPANASFQVKFNPDVIAPDALRARLKELEQAAEHADAVLDTRIIEVPVFYNDPWTHEALMRFRERHQAPDMTDLEYAAKINGYASVDALIAAHA
ncbi:MAG: carboxyltransferase domain-containing protein, partial [Acidisphaera sp.]|nr:carboxyltransferase domain-containing protein [Acidisphaera sp.]